MRSWRPIAWLLATVGIAPALAVCAASPADRLRAAILDAAATGAPDPVDAALADRRHPDGIVLDLELADDQGEPIADCLAGHPRPPGVSPADWQALAAWPGLCDRGDAEGRSARLQLLDLDGNRCQVGLDFIFEQAALLGVEAFGLGGELHALQERVLVGEFGVERLAVAQFGEQATRQFTAALESARGRSAEAFRIQQELDVARGAGRLVEAEERARLAQILDLTAAADAELDAQIGRAHV